MGQHQPELAERGAHFEGIFISEPLLLTDAAPKSRERKFFVMRQSLVKNPNKA
jgi:hypothetical protein